MPVTSIIGYLLASPFTSSAGVGLLLSNLGPILSLLGSGAPLMAVVQDSHFSALLAAFAALAAKDMHVTGGTKQQ